MRLACGVALADDNAVEPVIADHPAPAGVVEIEHQRAAALAHQRRDDGAESVGEERGKVDSEGALGNME